MCRFGFGDSTCDYRGNFAGTLIIVLPSLATPNPFPRPRSSPAPQNPTRQGLWRWGAAGMTPRRIATSWTWRLPCPITGTPLGWFRKARFAPPLPVAGGVNLPSVAPLLADFETDTEAKEAVPTGPSEGRPPRPPTCPLRNDWKETLDHHTLVIASPAGRGNPHTPVIARERSDRSNPVGNVQAPWRTSRRLPHASAGLPRRPFRPPRNDRERVAPLLAGLETDTEAKAVAAEAGRRVVAPGGAQERPGVGPGAAA